MNIVIILGYGVFHEGNSQYQGYLDKALQIALKQKADFILATGGCSNKDFPEYSEAQSIKDYLLTVDPTLADKIVIEDQSLSTPQNLEYCLAFLKQKNLLPTKLFITADNIRAPKAYLLALQVFNTYLKLGLDDEAMYRSLYENYLTIKSNILQDYIFEQKSLTVCGIDIGRSKEDIANQITSSILEVMSLKYPKTHQAFIEKRKKEWGIK